MPPSDRELVEAILEHGSHPNGHDTERPTIERFFLYGERISVITRLDGTKFSVRVPSASRKRNPYDTDESGWSDGSIVIEEGDFMEGQAQAS